MNDNKESVINKTLEEDLTYYMTNNELKFRRIIKKHVELVFNI